jgi:class 3 adenylate cyclase
MVHPGSSIPQISEAEALQMTILRCDLVGSTRAKKPLDLEGQLAFQSAFQEIVRKVAGHYSGAHIERFEGDGAMILFGFPRPSEDASESAIRMGLELIDTIEAAEILPNLRLQIRVGIASGLVAVLKQLSTPQSDRIGGITMDLAERLRALAGPGQVVLCETTKRIAAGFFSYEDLGVVKAKGFDEGIQAWRIARALPIASRFEARQSDFALTEIVGRTDVLTRLSNAWTSALEGMGQAICLFGEAGIGKSLLALTSLDAATRDGAATLKIDCTPSTGNTPMFPIGVLLQRTANITLASSEADKRGLAQQFLARLLPDDDVQRALAILGPLFGLEGMAPPADLAPADVREQTILTILQIVRHLATEGPLAILCEDLHWVDDTTARVIDRLAAEIANLRVLLIVTTRPTSDPTFELSAFVPIELQPLDSSIAADLVRSVAKEATLAEDIVRRIVDRCEGVPLILVELTRSTIETASHPDEASVAANSGEAVPTPLQIAVQARLYRRPQFAPVVQSASVLGREFSLSLLQQVVPDNIRSQIIDAIEVFTREGLVERSRFGSLERVRFTHMMICESIYNTLLGSDRQRLHSRIADVLREDYKETAGAAPDLIAEHLRKGRRFVEAIQVRLAASGDTVARGAYVETEGHCVAALSMIEEVADPDLRTSLQFRLLIQLGVALTGEHGYSAAVVEDTYRRAHALCGHSAQAEMLYPIMRGLATVNLVRGNLVTAYDLSVQNLKLAEQAERVEFRIDALSVLCFTTLYFGRLADCRLLIEQCLELYRRADGHRLVYPVPQDAGTAAITLLPTVMWLLGDSQAAEDAIGEGLAHIERLNRDFDKAIVHCWIAGTRITQRRYAEAVKHAECAVQMAQQHGYQEWYAHALLLGSIAQGALHPNPEAVAQATGIYEAFEKAGVGVNAPYYLWGIAIGLIQAGDIAGAMQKIEEALGRAEERRELRMNPELLVLQAEITPDDGKAVELLTGAMSLAEEQGAVANALRAAIAIALRSERDKARKDYAQATLDMLDGRLPCPVQRDWMQQRLHILRPGFEGRAAE